MFKAILSMLVGFATLIGSVATADDHKYQYLLSGINHEKYQFVRVMGTSGQTTTIKLELFDEDGLKVADDQMVTLLPMHMRRVFKNARITGTVPTESPFRTIRITADEPLWVHATRRTWEDSAVTISVFEKVLPCDHGTYPCTKDDDDEGTKGN